LLSRLQPTKHKPFAFRRSGGLVIKKNNRLLEWKIKRIILGARCPADKKEEIKKVCNEKEKKIPIQDNC
jgi:hypothetical protein